MKSCGVFPAQFCPACFLKLHQSLNVVACGSVCVAQDERSRVAKQLQEQDLLLEVARRNVHTELQRALRDKSCLRKEL